LPDLRKKIKGHRVFSFDIALPPPELDGLFNPKITTRAPVGSRLCAPIPAKRVERSNPLRRP